MSSASSSPWLADDSRDQSLEVVVVGLGAAERRCERAEGRRLDDRGVLLGGQPRSAQQVDEAIVLSLGGDRLEFGGEAVDAAVELVLGLDRLRGREVGAAVLEDAVQHGPAR